MDAVEWIDFDQRAQLALFLWLVEAEWRDNWPADEPETCRVFCVAGMESSVRHSAGTRLDSYVLP